WPTAWGVMKIPGPLLFAQRYQLGRTWLTGRIRRRKRREIAFPEAQPITASHNMARGVATKPWAPATERFKWGQSPRPLQWHWTDVGVAHCFDSSSNKILSPRIPIGISYVKTLQRTANPPEYGRGNQAVSTQRRECTPMGTRSFALARLCRHREAFLHPRFPERRLAGDGPGRLIAVKVEVQRNHALAAAVEGAKGGYARPRLVEPQQGVVRTLTVVLCHPAEPRHAPAC